MYQLKEHLGIPRPIILTMAIMAGVTVANLYYNQSLLAVISCELHVSALLTNLITVLTQIGYVLGLMFIIPSGDMVNRRRIIVLCMCGAFLGAVIFALSTNVFSLWAASLLLGCCSVTPQIFIPIANEYSKPERKSRNMGYVLSGLLTGILGARVVSGFVGEWLGWRAMYLIAAAMMLIGCGIILRMLPNMGTHFSGTYAHLLRSVYTIFRTNSRIRFYSFRAAFAFGSMLSVWACLAFYVASPPLCGGSDMVGVLGLCGVVGALTASGVGRFIPRFGIRRISLAGVCIQLVAWVVAFVFRSSYWGLAVAIIVLDIGTQFLQLSNQSGCIQQLPNATNRANTIFMTIYFVGGCAATFLAAQGWQLLGWTGVCLVGFGFSLCALGLSVWKGQ